MSEQQLRDGEEAQFLLSHRLYVGACTELETELFELLAEVNMHDQATKDEYLRSLKNLRRLKGVLERHIANGEAAKHLLARTAKDRIRNAIGI